MLGSASFNLNLDRQLPNSVDINIAPATDVKEFQLQGGVAGARDGETFAVPVYTARVSPSFGPVTDVVSNANASFSGLTLEARRGAASGREGYGGAGRGLEFRAAWTWSKAIDFGQNSGAVPRANGQFDPFSVGYDKGLSAMNFPHRVVATMTWSPRLRGADPLVYATAERAVWEGAGWLVAGGHLLGNERTRIQLRHLRWDAAGWWAREHQRLGRSSAVLPTVGRNTLRLPDSMNLDLRVSRGFRLGETLRLRAAVEAFNVTNHVNYSGVTQRAFLVGTAVNGVTPLVFQDAAAVATEGLNVQPFGRCIRRRGTNQARRAAGARWGLGWSSERFCRLANTGGVIWAS